MFKPSPDCCCLRRKGIIHIPPAKRGRVIFKAFFGIVTNRNCSLLDGVMKNYHPLRLVTRRLRKFCINFIPVEKVLSALHYLLRISSRSRRRVRKSDENDRNLRITDKHLRITGKNLRITAKNLRITGKDLRITGKNLRITGKDLRITGRNLRITANYLRITAKDLHLTCKK